MGKTIIKNCDIADFDTLKYDRKDILIEDDLIVKIADSVPAEGNETVIDAAGKMALPAFVDCHAHLLQSFYKGYMDDYPITDWLVRLFHAEDLATEEDNYYAVLLSCMQGLRFGTTTINDMGGYRFIDSTVQAVRDAGMRATLGVSHTDVAENDATPIRTVEDALRESNDIYTRYHGLDHDMIRMGVAPAGLPACSKELMQALKAFANERGLVFHTHLGEGKKETQDVKNRTGWWEAETLYNYGLLDERTLLAHSIWLQDYELDLIKKAGANPVHCPNTNMKISDGIPKIHQMLQRGINVCIGCDGEASSSTRDMIREARAGAYLQKAVTLDPTAMDLSSTYKMMTQNGAKALGYQNLGRLAEGYKADILLVDMSKDISLTNRSTRLSNLLYAGTGHAVDTVFVNGRMVLSGGENLRMNTGKVLEKCEELLYKLDQKMAKL